MNCGAFVLRASSSQASARASVVRRALSSTSAGAQDARARTSTALPYHKGQELEADCFRLAHDSQGVCILGAEDGAAERSMGQQGEGAGMIAFVTGAVPGERVRLTLSKVSALSLARHEAQYVCGQVYTHCMRRATMHTRLAAPGYSAHALHARPCRSNARSRTATRWPL